MRPIMGRSKKPRKGGKGRLPAGAPPITLILLVAGEQTAEAFEDAGADRSAPVTDEAVPDSGETEGCAEINPDDDGRFSVEGSCVFFPPWSPGGAIDLYDGKVDGVINETLFHLYSGKVRLLAPVDGSTLTVSVEGARVFHITPQHETHVVFTDYGTIKVKSVRGTTTVDRSNTSADVLNEGEGKEYDLANTVQGCSSSAVTRDAGGPIPFHEGIPLIVLLCMVVAGRRVWFYLSTNWRDRNGSQSGK